MRQNLVKKNFQLFFFQNSFVFLFSAKISHSSSARHRYTEPGDEESEGEMSDGEINKLLIITPQRPKKHDGFDRTSNCVSRVKMSQDMASAINDGLYNYEDELWEQSDEEQWIETPGSNSKHVFLMFKML